MLSLHPEPLSLILLSVLSFFALIQLLWHFIVYGKLLKKTEYNIRNKNWQKVSIIICARSEYDNLQRLIPALLNQKYPDFEIIIVDDASWDGTTGYLEELCKVEPRVKAVYVTDEMKKNYQGKKLALSLGIKATSSEILLLTDADCVPTSDQWIQHMADEFHQSPDCEIVLGYSPVFKTASFSNIIARMDNLYTAVSYFSFALAKDPYMGVGRNMAYRKSLFFKIKGFANHLHIAPGDDDLFIQDAANSKNTFINLNPESFVFTESKKNFVAWFKQKKRHNFVGKYYKFKHRFKLGFLILTHLLLWFSLAANAFAFDTFGWALSIIALFWLIKWPLIYHLFKKFNQAGMSIWMPVFDILYVFYNIAFGFISLFGKQKKW
jgi:glycosyltransferase involved in cell wall biosynthesis